MTEMVRLENSKPPALLFENIPDHPPKSRLLTGMYNTSREKAGFNARLIFEAVRPFEWKDKFPLVVERDPEVEQSVRANWKELL